VKTRVRVLFEQPGKWGIVEVDLVDPKDSNALVSDYFKNALAGDCDE
jgi:hypothetical protein